ncbi:type II toxin-antitoxin system RelE/ParE family toxin [Candidatus Microgenomates bacterium]|nr:type II toxin-antitoxin system RelE/ParE family toxin [Candidatus Microgenomates bacterium]
MVKWKIDYYSTPSGKEPVQKFIEKLAYKPRSRVHNALELLAEFGTSLSLPHVKKVINTPLWELRILGEKSLRFFYVAKVGRIFLLLHGFSKKTQKIPKKEIKTALKRLREYKGRTES